MRKLRLLLPPMVLILAALAAAAASAAGLGPASGAPVLGQPLDLVVPLRLEGADVPAPQCVRAELRVGERRLPDALVQARVEAAGQRGAAVRIRTTQAIDEPVVGVHLAVGCPATLARSFVVFADPPELRPRAAAAATPAVPRQALVPMAADAMVAAGRVAPDASTRTPTATVAPKSVPGRTALRATGVSLRRSVQATARTTAAAARRASQGGGRTLTPVALRQAVAEPAAARLRLDVAALAPVATTAAVDEALQAVAEAASAARASAVAASAADARIAVLEADLARLQAQAGAGRDELALARAQLAEARQSGRWFLPLLALLALAAAVSAWLLWRLAHVQRDARQGWLAEAGRPADADPSRSTSKPAPLDDDEVPTPASVSQPVARQTEPPDFGAMRTEPLDTMPPRDIAGPRDVSIEELIDLEQQADFFAVLGQDEAAIDLLVQHLRETGGASPLPYLKLLEIHQRRDDREAYERMRLRFNHRFNAYAPEWGADAQGGRSLEDYPGVLPRLQQVWPRPLEAMGELEALLFRKSRGELFELPAYREVLFLYSLSRDLADREAVDTTTVDVLLPLADGGAIGAAAASQPTEALAVAEATAATVLDLDLGQATRPGSIFDPVEPRTPVTPRPLSPPPPAPPSRY